MKTAIAFVVLASSVAVLAGGLQAQRPGPAAGKGSTEEDVEVRVTGCVLGSTITETGPARTEGGADGRPVRRWRLLLTPKQRQQVKAIGPKQIEVAGLANRREIEESAAVTSRKARRGGITLRAAAAATASPLVAPRPTPMASLTAKEITATSASCR